MKHGIDHYIKHGKVPRKLPGREKLVKRLTEVRLELEKTIPDLSPAKQIILDETLKAVMICWLTGLYVGKYGPLDPAELEKGRLELQPVLGKSFIAYLNTIRLNFIALGLSSRVKDDGMDLQRFIREFDENKAREAEEKVKVAVEGGDVDAVKGV